MIGLRPYAAGDGYLPAPGGRRRYYDDNAWIGLCFAQLHLQTGEARWLRRARKVFRFVREGQDPDGGMRWVEGRRARTHLLRGAGGPARAAAAPGRRRRRDPRSSLDARSRWLDRTLRVRGGLYADHVDARGRVDRTLWTYNQGAPIGAHLLLHLATGDDDALERAQATAAASLRRFGADRTWQHPPVFNAVWFRNLLALDALAPVAGHASGARRLPRASLARGPRRRRAVHGRRHRQLRRHVRRSTRQGSCSSTHCAHGLATVCRWSASSSASSVVSVSRPVQETCDATNAHTRHRAPARVRRPDRRVGHRSTARSVRAIRVAIGRSHTSLRRRRPSALRSRARAARPRRSFGRLAPHRLPTVSATRPVAAAARHDRRDPGGSGLLDHQRVVLLPRALPPAARTQEPAAYRPARHRSIRSDRLSAAADDVPDPAPGMDRCGRRMRTVARRVVVHVHDRSGGRRRGAGARRAGHRHRRSLRRLLRHVLRAVVRDPASRSAALARTRLSVPRGRRGSRSLGHRLARHHRRVHAACLRARRIVLVATGRSHREARALDRRRVGAADRGSRARRQRRRRPRRRRPRRADRPGVQCGLLDHGVPRVRRG